VLSFASIASAAVAAIDVQRENMGPVSRFDSVGCFTPHFVQNAYRHILDM